MDARLGSVLRQLGFTPSTADTSMFLFCRHEVTMYLLVYVVDPILVWWRSRGPVAVPRLPDTAEVVRHRVSEEDEHVRRYMVVLEGRFDHTWQVLQGCHWSYDPVMVPSLWVSTARDDTRRALRF